ncbi:hypothetical protein SDC9_178547 [bioreactor metagenome]|uniref:Uncharacterized protein n=1 Tax=bioreactor metagenome TaxID=1076179 RepID=A0A645H5F3_9ZZZZ
MPGVPGTRPSTASAGAVSLRSRSMMDRPTAMAIPISTSKAITPAAVRMARISSLRRNRATRRHSRRSISFRAAKITTAPSAAEGNAPITGPRKNRVARTQASDTTDASCVRLPIAAPRAVRLPLLLTGNPPDRPAAAFAAARARNSWSGSISRPCRVANERPVSTLSV